MPRLSDRAFQIIKNEIERRFGDSPQDQIDRVILLARLENMRKRQGRPMTRVEIWEELSDIDPYFDDATLVEAANIDADSPLVGASIGVGAVAMLVATAIGVETIASPNSAPPLNGPLDGPLAAGGNDGAKASSNNPVKALANSKTATQGGLEANQPSVSEPTAKVTQTKLPALPQQPSQTSQTADTAAPQTQAVALANPPVAGQPQAEKQSSDPKTAEKQLSAYEMARHYGWQAALKGQNPPHNAQRWEEASKLWKRAISHLDAIPNTDPSYKAAQQKIAFYQQNLQQTEAHRLAAIKPATVATNPAPTANQTPGFATKATATKPAAQPKVENAFDALAEAKRHGWQAALASQNAPHPAHKWADISRQWQLALQNLEKVDEQHPSYTEAQAVKERYEKNLVVIRQRYALEQEASQRLQSLEATLEELNAALVSDSNKRNQLSAIVARLHTIPEGTLAHARAQQLIRETNQQISQLTDSDQKLALYNE